MDMLGQDTLYKSVKATWEGDGSRKIKNALETYLRQNKSATDKLMETYKGAMDTQTASEGGALIDTILFRGIMEKVRVFGNVAPLFQNMVMPSAVYEIPVQLTDVVVTLQAENTSSTGQTTASSSIPTSGKATLTAKKLTGASWVSTELEEDGVIDVINYIIDSHAQGIAYAMDEMIVNGDTTYSDTRNVIAGWDGLRKLALAVSGLKVDAGGDALAVADLNGAITKMKKNATRKGNLRWIMGTDVLHSLEALGTATSNSNQIGFTFSGGDIVAYRNIPIVATEVMDGRYTSAGALGGALGMALLVDTSRFKVGTKSEISFQSERKILEDQDLLVSRVRKAFTPLVTPSATETSVTAVYNVLV